MPREANLEIENAGSSSEKPFLSNPLFWFGVLELLVTSIGMGYYSLEFFVRKLSPIQGVTALSVVFLFGFGVVKLQGNIVNEIRRRNHAKGDYSIIIPEDIAALFGKFWQTTLPFCGGCDFETTMRAIFKLIARLVPVMISLIYLGLVAGNAVAIFPETLGVVAIMACKLGFIVCFIIFQIFILRISWMLKVLALSGAIVILGYFFVYGGLLIHVRSNQGVDPKAKTLEWDFAKMVEAAAYLFASSGFMAYYLIYEQRQTARNRNQNYAFKALLTSVSMMFIIFGVIIFVGKSVWGKDDAQTSVDKISAALEDPERKHLWDGAKSSIIVVNVLMGTNLLASLGLFFNAIINTLGPRSCALGLWFDKCLQKGPETKEDQNKEYRPEFDLLRAHSINSDTESGDEMTMQTASQGCPPGIADMVLLILGLTAWLVPDKLILSGVWTITVLVMPFVQGMVHVFAWLELTRKENGRLDWKRLIWLAMIVYLGILTVGGGQASIAELIERAKKNKEDPPLEYNFFFEIFGGGNDNHTISTKNDGASNLLN